MLKQITLVLLSLSLGLTAVAQDAAPAPAKTASAPPNAVAAALVKQAPAKVVTLPPLAPKAGTIRGRVVDETGKPVPIFTIRYYGYQDGVHINNGAENVDADVQGSGGAYSIKVPPGAYGASAYVTYRYHNRDYKFMAQPLNLPNQYDYPNKQLSNSKGGLVRDFILRMSTKKDGAEEDTESGYFNAYGGGTIILDAELWGTGGDQAPPPLYVRAGAPPYPLDSRLLVTLTPQGPMVDGSTGRVVHINVRLGDTGKRQGSQRGIYPGVYSATATLSTPAGETVPLRLAVRNARNSPVVKGSEWTPSATVDFLPYVLGLDGGLQTIKLFPAK